MSQVDAARPCRSQAWLLSKLPRPSYMTHIVDSVPRPPRRSCSVGYGHGHDKMRVDDKHSCHYSAAVINLRSQQVDQLHATRHKKLAVNETDESDIFLNYEEATAYKEVGSRTNSRRFTRRHYFELVVVNQSHYECEEAEPLCRAHAQAIARRAISSSFTNTIYLPTRSREGTGPVGQQGAPPCMIRATIAFTNSYSCCTRSATRMDLVRRRREVQTMTM